ncbi:MAG: Acetate kinase [Frankiales bacterium]|nr:Acetate kinase [Frankiales bacterium]
MTDVVLAVNPGSSSLKVVAQDEAPRLRVQVERLGTPSVAWSVDGRKVEQPAPKDVAGALVAVRDLLRDRQVVVDAVAHRVVHGGPHHAGPARVDADLLAELRALVPLAPLHLPTDLLVIETARELWPGVPHVACFDTAFHHGLPDEARRLPVAQRLADAGMRRYGFHGLSLQSVVDAHPHLGAAVVAHLGAGCSVSAVQDGRSRHTTMSLTPTGGVPSATRSGDLDPEVVLQSLESGLRPADLRDLLEHQSGLAGIAAGRSDVRDLLAARQADPAADLALRVFTRSVAMAIAGCAVTLDRWDALVFTGGVGEHATELRAKICARLAASLRLPSVLVVRADEEGVMDRQARLFITA